MKKTVSRILSIVLAVVMLAALAVPSFAYPYTFDEDAYASVIIGSDFQKKGTLAYEQFEKMLVRMQDDGLTTPHSMIAGGDYTKALLDDAAPGIYLIKQIMTEHYPDMDPDSVICIQGNHDNPCSGFTTTGLHEMGVYNLYVMNEHDFCWNQLYRSDARMKCVELAADITKCMNELIAKGDMRPVIFASHVPLHHSARTFGGDNMYSKYVFDAINKAAETLDIIFLFGHNHSQNVDDYIGGSVNLLYAGDEIRIPDPTKISKTEYYTETLNFTYANYGYVGYSCNTASDTSVNRLTLGCLRFYENEIKLVRYYIWGEGAYYERTITRKNPGTQTSEQKVPELSSNDMWQKISAFFDRFAAFWQFYFKLMLR